MRTRALSGNASRRILKAAHGKLLIGGQALAWWIAQLEMDVSADFPDGVTFDFDFLASRREAEEVHRQLGGNFHIASLDDHTPQTAKLFFANFEGEGPLEIDFLASMVGGDEEKVRKRAIEIDVDGARFLVLHPFDVLRTRVANLHVLRDRAGNPRYVKQAKLAVRVVRAYLEQALRDTQNRLVLRVVEALAELAESEAGLELWRKQGLDVLQAVPAADIPSPAFRERRWPQILKRISKKRGAP